MAQRSVTIAGATYSNVPGIEVPLANEQGNAYFVETSDADAVAADLAQGKTAYVNGSKIVGTNTGGGTEPNSYIVESKTLLASSDTISFVGITGEEGKSNDPIAFWLYSTSSIPTGTPSKVATVVYDGTTTHGQIITNTNNAQVTYASSGFSWAYNSATDTITITSTNAQFQAGGYEILYCYGGSTSDVYTKNVQVGSGATSISFTGIEFSQGEMFENFFVFFKSNFGTSSGYSRVIATNIYLEESDVWGLEMANQASFSSNWAVSFSNGALTLSSNSASSGGYFHQPGYYELVYVKRDAGQSPIVPTGTINISQNGVFDVTEYASASVSVSGGSVPAPWQDTTGATTTSATIGQIGSTFTVQTAGVYRINAFGWRSNTSGTWAMTIYKNGSAVTGGTVSWTSNRGVSSAEVTCAVNDVISIYGQSRGTNYTLTLIGWTAAYKGAS